MGIESDWKEVIEQGDIDVFLRGNTRLIPRVDAPKFAHWAVSKGKRILGFEGFIFDGESVQPLTECITDFSSATESENGLEATLKILAEPDFQKPNFIEFVLDDQRVKGLTPPK